MKKINKLLTIAIPTFNRHKQLLNGVEILCRSLPANCQLLIVDNASSPTVESFLSTALKCESLQIIRNSTNIGGNSNVLRCIEHCDTPYIWIIGDDDYINESAFDSVLSRLTDETIWINFCERSIHQPLRTVSSSHESLEGFIQELTSISELVFISNNIFRTEIIKAGIQAGFHYQSMMAPHIVAMLKGLSLVPAKGCFMIVNEELFCSTSNNTDETTTWPLYQAFIGIMCLYQIPFESIRSSEVIRLIRGARMGWLKNRFFFTAMRGMGKLIGKKQATLVATSLFGPLLIIDGPEAVITLLLIYTAILFGESIDKIYKVLLKLSLKQ